MTSHNRKSDKAIFMEKVQSEIKNARLHFRACVDWGRMTEAQRESVAFFFFKQKTAYEMLGNEAKPKGKRVAHA